MVIINPDHKAGYFLGGVALGGGVARIPLTTCSLMSGVLKTPS